MAYSAGDASTTTIEKEWQPAGYEKTMLVVKLKNRPVFVNAESLKEEYKCELCQDILLFPVQTPCRARVCKGCINKKFGAKLRIKCPLPHAEYREQEICKLKCKRDGLVKKELKADLAVQNILAAELCYCVNKPYGCNEKNQWAKLKAHEARCTKNPCPCKNPGCTELSSQDQQLKHSQMCMLSMVACRYCKQPSVRRDLTKHYHDCNYNRATCGTCSKPLHRVTQMKVHKKVSPCCITSAGWCYFSNYCGAHCSTARILSQHLMRETNVHLQAITAQALLMEYSLSRKHLDTEKVKNLFDEKQKNLSVSVLSAQFSRKEVDWEMENQLREYGGTGLKKFKSIVEAQAELERKVQDIFSKFINIPAEQIDLSRNMIYSSYENEMNLAYLANTMQVKEWSRRDGKYLWKIADPEMMKDKVLKCVRSAWFYSKKGHRVYIQAENAPQPLFHHDNVQLNIEVKEDKDDKKEEEQGLYKMTPKGVFHPVSVTFILLPRSPLAQPFIRSKQRTKTPGRVRMKNFCPKSVLTDPKYFKDGVIYIQCIINEEDESNLRFVPPVNDSDDEDGNEPPLDENMPLLEGDEEAAILDDTP